MRTSALRSGGAYLKHIQQRDPRIGIAYDPFGDHKTAIRVGFGVFYDPIRARSYASGYYFNPPYALAFVPLPQFPNPFPGALPPPAQLVGVDYHTTNIESGGD